MPNQMPKPTPQPGDYDSPIVPFNRQPPIQSYEDVLERTAKVQAHANAMERALAVPPFSRGMVPPKYGPSGAEFLQQQAAGTNIGMPDRAMGRAPMYLTEGSEGAYGWTNKTGETFISKMPRGVEEASYPNTIGHEQGHASFRPFYMPQLQNNLRQDVANRVVLADNIDLIQPPKSQSTQYWGADPNRSPEEQMANLMGYEGSLPAGTPISQSPIAPELFKPGNYLFTHVTPQMLKDYYYQQSSLGSAKDKEGRPVGQGVWEGQAPPYEPGVLSRVSSTVKNVAKRLGLNMERFNDVGTTEYKDPYKYRKPGEAY